VGRRKRHTPDEVIARLRDADRLLSEGKSVGQLCQQLGVGEATYHRWRNTFGGMKQEDMRELKRLQEENRRLKKAVADLTLDKMILEEVAEGKW
jgi:transposase-like protein